MSVIEGRGSTWSAAQVRRFWTRMCARYGTRLFDRARAAEMRASGWVLEALGIMEREVFMERYTTVWGHRIYPCFEPGEGDAQERWRQVVVCVHEHQHVEQYARAGGAALYALRYLASPRQRALYEAEAYGCNLEMTWLRARLMPDLDVMAARLERYGCGPAHVALARHELGQNRRGDPSGGVSQRGGGRGPRGGGRGGRHSRNQRMTSRVSTRGARPGRAATSATS